MNDLALALAVFVLILTIMVTLRTKIGEKFEVKNSDVLTALIPIAFWFILTGKIQRLEFGEFKIEAAFVEASKAAVAPQITPVKLPVESVRMDPKGSVEEIPRLIRNKTEALVFQLGYGGYYGPAIEEYLRQLSGLPFFKYVVINQSDGKLVGLADARELNSVFSAGGVRYDDFARWINESDTASLANLPGFVSAKNAIEEDTDKQTALERMETLNSEALPVVNKEEKFVGTVDRSRLVSSLILEVARKVE